MTQTCANDFNRPSELRGQDGEGVVLVQIRPGHSLATHTESMESCPQEPAAPTSFQRAHSRVGTLWTTFLSAESRPPKTQLPTKISIVPFSIQLAWGLHHSHERGVVHQDVKPQNALIFGESHLKICDFGIAGVKAAFGNTKFPATSSETILVNGSNAMTVEYCSPEQYSGTPLSRKTDIWSWGLCVLEMFTRGISWTHGPAAKQVLAHLIEDDDSGNLAVAIPRDLVNVLKCCFEVDPGNRPKNALECATLVQQVFANEFQTDYFRRVPDITLNTLGETNNRALSLIDLGKPDEAIQVLERAISKSPNDRTIAFNYGLLQWRLGTISDNKFLDLMNDCRFETNNELISKLELGLACYELGYFQEAVDSLANYNESGYNASILQQFYHKSVLRLEISDNPRIKFETPVENLVFTGNSKNLLTLENGGDNLRSFEIETGITTKFETAGREILFLTNGATELLLWGVHNSGFQSWDVVTGQLIREVLTGRQISQMVVHKDRNTALVAFVIDRTKPWETCIELIDLDTGFTLQKYDEDQYGSRILNSSEDGSVVVTSWKDLESRLPGPETAFLWQLSDGRINFKFKSRPTSGISCYFSENHDKLYVLYSCGHESQCIDLSSGSVSDVFPKELGSVKAFYPSRNEELAVIESTIKQAGAYIDQWSLVDLVDNRTIRVLFRANPDCGFVAKAHMHARCHYGRISADGRFLAWIWEDDTVQILRMHNWGGVPYLLKEPEKYSVVNDRNLKHRELVIQVRNEFKKNNHTDVVEVLRKELDNAAPEFIEEVSELWDQLSSIINIVGVISVTPNYLLADDDCLIDDHNFSGKFCFDSSSPEVFVALETLYDCNKKRANAGIVCWNTKTNTCRVIVKSLPKIREVGAITLYEPAPFKTAQKIICADKQYILCYSENGLLMWKIDRGKPEYDINSVSIAVSSCGFFLACSVTPSWRYEHNQEIQRPDPVTIWSLPMSDDVSSCESVEIVIDSRTKYATGIKFLPGIADRVIFGCNLGIQICTFLKDSSFSIFGGNDGEVYLLDISSCSNYAAAAYQNGAVKNSVMIWNVSNQAIPLFSMIAEARVVGIKLTPCAKMLLVYLENEVLQIYSVIDRSCCYETKISSKYLEYSSTGTMELAPNGSLVFIMGFSKLIGLKIRWDH